MATPGQFIEQAMLSGFEQGQAQRQNKKAEARQEKIKLRDQLATKISSLEEGTPEHKQAKDLLVQVDTDLMDPNHPMPIEKIKNLLTGHFGHKQPAQPAPSVTTQVGGVSTPDISSGPSIPSAEHLLSVPALGQTAVSAPTPITIPEPPTEAPAAPTEAAQPPARNYASPDNTSGVVDPRQFRPSTPMLRRAFPAKPGFHLVTNPMEGQKAYYQSDSDPSDIREAKTGLKKKVSVEDASATTPASQKAAPGASSTPATSQSSYPTGKATPLSQTDKDAITQQFPAYAPYLDQVVIHPMEKGESPEDWSETYVPWESKNPAPGKLTMEPYAKTTPDEYRHMVTGEMLHYIGGVNPQTGQPINPEYQNLKQAVAAAAPPGLKKMDQDSYREAQRKGDKRSFEDWYNQSRLDETIMGYVNPDKQDNWRKAGVYNDPKMHQAVENLRQYLTGTSPNAAPAAVPKPGTGKPGSPLNPYSAAPYNNAGMEPPEEAYARNKQWAKAPGPNGYVTQLAQDQEARFQEWAHKPENWDYVQGDMGPTPGYDIRGWFQAMEAGDPRAKKDPKTHHFNDYWKTPYSGEGFGRESKYGTPDGPYWTGNDQVGWSSVTSDGRQVLSPWKPTQNPTEQSQAVSPTAQGQPAAPAATTDTGQLPALPTPAVSIPGHELTVKGPAQPKLSPRQQKAQSQAEQQAQLEIAAAGLTPEEKGIAQARADAAGNLFAFQANMKLYDIIHPEAIAPNATPEAKQARQDHQNFLLEGASKTQNYKPDVQNLTLADGTQISAQWTPNPALPAKGSWQYLNGKNIESSQLDGARIAPKPTTKKGMKYDPQTGEVVDQDTLTRYSVTDVATGTVPPDVVKIFNDAKTTMDDKQKKALELATQRGNALGAGRYGPFIDPNNPTQVIPVSYGEASKRGLHLALGAQYKTMEAMLRSSTSGPIAEQMVQFGTAFQHADLLEQAATDLHNGNNRAINLIKNDWITAFGGEAPTDFKVIATAYTREVNKALSSGHVTDAELSEVGATIPQNASLDQIYGAVRAYRKLMQSKIQIRAAQIEAGMQGAPYMGPGAQPPNTGGGRPKGAIGTFPHNGKNYWVDAQGNNLGVAP